MPETTDKLRHYVLALTLAKTQLEEVESELRRMSLERESLLKVIQGWDVIIGNYIDDYLRHLFKNLCTTLTFRLQSVRE